MSGDQILRNPGKNLRHYRRNRTDDKELRLVHPRQRSQRLLLFDDQGFSGSVAGKFGAESGALKLAKTAVVGRYVNLHIATLCGR